MAAVQQILIAAGTSNIIFLPSDLIASAEGTSYGNDNASAGVTLKFNTTNGTANLEYSAIGTEYQDPQLPVANQYNWLVSGLSSLYSVRVSNTAGSFTTGSSPVNTWIPVGGPLNWFLLSSSTRFQRFSVRSVVGKLELAYSDNLTNIVANSNISFSTQAETFSGDIL